MNGIGEGPIPLRSGHTVSELYDADLDVAFALTNARRQTHQDASADVNSAPVSLFTISSPLPSTPIHSIPNSR
jgi:hypothetical protein